MVAHKGIRYDCALTATGYDGFISIEFEGMEDNILGIDIGLENLRRYIAE